MQTRLRFTPNKSNTEPLIDQLRNRLVKTRNQRLISGCILSVSGLMIVLFYQGLHENPFDLFSLLVYFGIFAGMLLVFRGLLRFDTDSEELIKVMQSDADSIRWVYYLNFQLMPFGIHIYHISTLHIMLNNGNHISLRAPENEIIQIMESMRTYLPCACFGYSREKEQLYLANPDLLRP